MRFIVLSMLVAATLASPSGMNSVPMEDGSIFDTSRMKELVVSEVHKNGYFKTYFAKDRDTLLLVTDYRTTSLVSPGTKITGTFIFVGLRKVLYHGTQYEIPEYAVYENQKNQDQEK